MKKIWKYELEDKLGEQSIRIPSWSKPLSIRYQNNEYGKGIMVYFEIEPDMHLSYYREHFFYIICTGDFTPKWEYMGNIETDQNEILHVYYWETE